MDNLVLSADDLRTTADIVNNYAERQKNVIDKYLRDVSNLNCNWEDDETFSTLIKEIVSLRSIVYTKMDGVKTYANIFLKKAEMIENRPTFNKNYGDNNQNSYIHISSLGDYKNRQIKIINVNKMDIHKLNDEMCRLDMVGNINDYVKISSNGSRISKLDNVGEFLSPTNGEKIFCKSIAWRSRKVEEANSINVCGADFYYGDGSFCGSYIGKNWKDIFENNYSDTKQFRK